MSDDSIDGLLGAYSKPSFPGDPPAEILASLSKHYTLSAATTQFCQQFLPLVDRICSLLSVSSQNCAIGSIVSLVDAYSKSLLAAFYAPALSEAGHVLMIQDLAFMTKKILPYVHQKLSKKFSTALREIEELTIRLKGLRETLVGIYCERTARQFFSDPANSASLQSSYQ
jgi:hypothetical protein